MKDEGKGFIRKNGTRNQVPCLDLHLAKNSSSASTNDPFRKPLHLAIKNHKGFSRKEVGISKKRRRGGEMRSARGYLQLPLTHIRLPNPTHPHGFLFLYSALKKEGDGVIERPCHKDPSAFPAKQAVNQGPGEHLPLGLLDFSPLFKHIYMTERIISFKILNLST